MAVTDRRVDPVDESPSRAADDPSRSGERRIERSALPSDEVLPPPPKVLTERTRIVTGRYAIITSPTPRTPR